MKRRRHPRLNVDVGAWLAWTDETGQQQRTTAKCVNISMSGASLDLPVALRAGKRVTVGVPRIPLEAAAIVRRSVPRGAGFNIGVEFTARRRLGEPPGRAGTGSGA